MTAAPTPLEAAIADLLSRRAQLGDAVVDAAVAALRAQMAAAPSAAASAPTSAVSPEPSAPEPAAPRLRQLSILFVDIANSTALLQALPADEALALVSPALERFAAVIRSAGGEVLRFTGDGLKAAFGTEGTREDEAERAVRAGLAILQQAQEHAAQFQRLHGVGAFGVRVGVHTGPVALGAGVEADRTAMGLAVHLAARMEQSAPVGHLRISQDTWSQVRGLFEMQRQPPLQVRGHDEPLTTYLVLRELQGGERAADRGVEGVATPMVGREREWRALMALFDRCRVQRESGSAWIIGEAGLGKTRLRRELVQACAAQAGAVLQARAHPGDALQPYGLVRQQLTRWLGIGGELPAEAARQRFEQALAPRLQPEGLPAARRLGHLLGFDFSAHAAVQSLGGRQLRELGFASWRQALQAAPDGGPTLLVFDDLQWADEASLEFIQRLAADPGPALMLVLLARPTLEERLPLQVAGPGCEVLRLAGLAQGADEALAEALLAAVQPPSAALQRLLVQRAAGNPFYMEELLRVLIDAGVVRVQPGAWQADESRLSTVRVPETLVGVLQARLDALPASDHRALQQASIVGPVFWDAALAELDSAAPAALPALQQRALVSQQPASTFADTEERSFHHPLLHEVTYASVLGPVRRAGHLQAARWLLRQRASRPDEFAAAAAQHFERGGDSDQAWRLYERATHHAMQRYAHREALALAERALALPAPADGYLAMRVRVRRADALERLGYAAESEQALDEATALAEALGDDTLRADVLSQRMLRADHAGQPALARRLAEETLVCALRYGGPRSAGSAALACGELAWLAVTARDFAAAQQHLEQGIGHARRAAQVAPEDGGYDGYELQLRQIGIHALAMQGRTAEVLSSVEEALASLHERRSPHQLDRTNLLIALVSAQLQLGRLDAAQATLQQLDALVAEIEMPSKAAAALAARLDLALARDEAADGQALVDQIARLTEGSGFASMQGRIESLRAELAQWRGDSEAAGHFWQRAAAASREQHDDAMAAAYSCQCAEHLADRGQAIALVNEALAQAQADGRPHHAWLTPDALLACHAVLSAAGDARAPLLLADLQARLQQQLDSLPDEAARRCLLQNVPCWRVLSQRLAAPD